MKIRFLGANRQVTGSCYLIEHDNRRILVDCGMFQERKYVSRNWSEFPVDPTSIDMILVTHAHLDHVGRLPRLTRQGFSGKIIGTAPTRDLADIVLEDAAGIQEEDAAYKRKRHRKEGRTGPHPVEPLFDRTDARDTMDQFHAVSYEQTVDLGGGMQATFHDAGHILGSSMIKIVYGTSPARTLLFSGDIGQRGKPIIRDPTFFDEADFVIMESTYGDRDHREEGPIEDQLVSIINDTANAGGHLLIPTFAIERAQELMYYIGRLVRTERVPNVRVFLDSPMAVDVTDVFRMHRDYMDAETWALINSGEPPLRFPGLKLVRATAESKAINNVTAPCIIMAGSGMCTAGRIKHHLVRHVGRRQSTVLFAGYQAAGTLGRELLSGQEEVRIHGKKYQVAARMAQLHGLSAHADRSDLTEWLGRLNEPPSKVFLTHGDEDAAQSLSHMLRENGIADVIVPEYESVHELT